jgi:hypothetical protein
MAGHGKEARRRAAGKASGIDGTAKLKSALEHHKK